jgi:hypothetical protein
MFVLSNSAQDFARVTRDAFRLTIASFSKAWLPSLIGNILLIIPWGLMYFFAESVEAVSPSWIVIALGFTCLFYPVLMSTTLLTVEAVADGRPIRLADCFRQAARTSLPCLIAAFLFLLLVGIGSVLLIAPGIFLFVSLSFWWVAIVTQEQGISEAFRTSRQLVLKNWWRTAFVLSVLFGIFCATPAMIETGMNLFPAALADTWPVELMGAALTILDLILTPILFSALMLVQTHDLQLRRQEAG